MAPFYLKEVMSSVIQKDFILKIIACLRMAFVDHRGVFFLVRHSDLEEASARSCHLGQKSTAPPVLRKKKKKGNVLI